MNIKRGILLATDVVGRSDRKYDTTAVPGYEKFMCNKDCFLYLSHPQTYDTMYYKL